MILGQTLRYLPAQVLGPLAQFAAVLAWTHWLPPADYGFIALIFAVQELAFTLCLSWWTHYTIRYLPGLPDRDAYARGEGAVLVLAALAQVPVVLAVLAPTGHLDSPALVGATLAFALSRTAVTHLGERARAVGDVATYTIGQLAGSVLGFLLGLGFMAVQPDAIAAIAGFALVQVAILPFLARRLGLRASLTVDAKLLRAALAYGGPLLVAGGFGWVSLNGIRFVVERLDGLALVGLVSVGWNLGQRLVGVVATLVTAAAFPLAVRRVAEDGAAAGIAQVGRAAILILGLILPATVGLVAITGPFTAVFVGSEFREATFAVLPIAALAAGVRNLRMHAVDQVYMIAERPGFLVALNAGEAATTMLLCALGLRWGGLPGACLGALAATGASTVVCVTVATVRHGFRMPFGLALRLCLAAAGMGVVLRLDVYPGGWPGLLVQVAAGAAVYAVLAGLLVGRALDLPARLSALRRGRR